MFPRVFFAKASIANQMQHSQTLCVSLIAPLCWVGCLGSRDVMVNLVHWPPSSAIRPHSELLICVGGILWDIGVKGVDSPGTYRVIVGAGLCMLFFWWTLSGQRSYLLLGSQLSFPVFMELQLRNSPGKWRVDNICLLELSLLWIIGLLIIPYHSQRNMCKRKYIGNWNIWQRALDQICYWHLIHATSLHNIGGGFNCLFSLVNWKWFWKTGLELEEMTNRFLRLLSYHGSKLYERALTAFGIPATFLFSFEKARQCLWHNRVSISSRFEFQYFNVGENINPCFHFFWEEDSFLIFWMAPCFRIFCHCGWLGGPLICVHWCWLQLW